MRRGSIAAAFAAMLWFGGAAQSEPCRLPLLATAHFATDKDGSLLVPITVGTETLYFALNGYANSLVYDEVAERLNFGRRHRVADDNTFFKGREIVRRRTTDFTIGNVRWRDFEFIPEGDRPDGTIASGTLGMDFLLNEQLDIEVNASAGVLNLLQPGACARPPWAQSEHGMPISADGAATLTLDGQPFTGVIDFSRPVSAMDFVALDARFLHVPLSPTAASGPADPRAPLDRTFTRMTIGEAAIANPVVHVQDMRDIASDEALRTRVKSLNTYAFVSPVRRRPPTATLWLGRAELQRLRLYYAYHLRQVFVTPVSGAPDTSTTPQETPDLVPQN